MRAYTRTLCWVCQKEISSAGAATVAHMRKHVREGILRQTVDRDGLYQFSRAAIRRATGEAK